MIDLTRPTDFRRTKAKLQEFWLVAICVAGKNGPVQAKKVDLFLKGLRGTTPFNKISLLDKSGGIKERLQKVKMGQYSRIEEMARKEISVRFPNYDMATADLKIWLNGRSKKHLKNKNLRPRKAGEGKRQLTRLV